MKKVTTNPHTTLRTSHSFATRLISSLVAEVFLFASILPAWALQTNPSHLRPSAAKDGAIRNNLHQELKDTQAKDGGRLTLPEPQERRVLESYQTLVDEILREAELKWRQKEQGQFWIGVQGSSATGKTQLGNVLAEQLNRQGIPAIRLWEDMWDVDRSTREVWQAQNDPRFQNHWQEWIRWEALKKGLDRIRGTSHGKVTLEKLYKSRRTDLTREFNIFPNTFVVYDGMYLSDPRHYPPRSFDLLVLLDAATEKRLLRHVERDKPLGRPEDVSEKAFHEVYLPEWEAYVRTIHPERTSHLIYDVTSFDRPVRLSYEWSARDGGSKIKEGTHVGEGGYFEKLAALLGEKPILEWNVDGKSVRARVEGEILGGFNEFIVTLFPVIGPAPDSDEGSLYRLLNAPEWKATNVLMPKNGSYGCILMTFFKDEAGEDALFFDEIQPSRAMRHVTASRVGKEVANAHGVWAREAVQYLQRLIAREMGIRHFYGRYPTPYFMRVIGRKGSKNQAKRYYKDPFKGWHYLPHAELDTNIGFSDPPYSDPVWYRRVEEARDGGAKRMKAPSRWNLTPFYSP